jgi:biotin carboxyl carrier protein
MHFRLVVDGEAHDIEVEPSQGPMTLSVDGATYRIDSGSDGPELRVVIRGRVHRIRIDGSRLLLDGTEHAVHVDEGEAGMGTAGAATEVHGERLEVRPPMPGRLVRLPVAAGGEVRHGQPVAVVEAMKMQNEIVAPFDAVVEEVRAKEGDTIGADTIIAVLARRTNPAR